MSYSPLYKSEAAWLIKLTAYKLSDGSSQSYYIAKRHYAAGDLYSGSPEAYPLLASAPGIIESMGRTFGAATDQTLSIFAKSSFMEFGQSFLDELIDYEKEQMKVEFFIYDKPRDNISTHTASINTQLVGFVKGYTYNGDVINLTVRREVLKEKEFKLSFNNTDDALPHTQYEEWEDEPIPMVFGVGESETGTVTDVQGFTDSTGQGEVILSSRVNGHNIGDINSLYILNRNRNLTNQTWIKADLSITNGIASAMSIQTGMTTGRSIRDKEYGFIIDRNLDFILNRVTFVLQVAGGAAAAGDSDIVVSLYKVESEDFATNKLILGDKIGENRFGSNLLTSPSGSNIESFFCIGLPAGKYFTSVKLSNSTATKDITIKYKATASTDGRRYERDNTVDGSAFTTATEYIEAEAIAVYDGALSTTNTNLGTKYYALGDIVEDGQSGFSPFAFVNNGTWKAGMTGLQDDGSGTYTGVASATMERPTDIIYFLLGHADLLNLSSDIDTTSFSTARSPQNDKQVKLSFATQGRIFLVELIGQILQQSLCQLWRDRENKIKVRFPTYTEQNKQYIYENLEQEEMKVLSVYETQANEVINDLRIEYDKTQVEISIPLALRQGVERTRLAYEINKDDSTDNDTYREGLASKSEAVHEKLPARLVFDMYASDSEAPKLLGKMLFDRFYKKKKRVSITLPLKKWLNTNMFDTIHIVNRLLESTESKDFTFYDSGSQIQFYRSGLKFQWKRKGSQTGEVIQVEKSDQQAILTIEEVLPF